MTLRHVRPLSSIARSIWSISTTEFLVIMPMSAIMPRTAMKPIGVLVTSMINTTPISPRGTTLMTSSSRCTLCSWNMSTIRMMTPITGSISRTEASPSSAPSTAPPTSIR
ncbi:hypothetical protein D3C80_1537980 [compost metagenome]